MTDDDLADFRTSLAYFLKVRGVRLAFSVDYQPAIYWLKVSWELGGQLMYYAHNLEHLVMPDAIDDVARGASAAIVASVIERGLAPKEAA